MEVMIPNKVARFFMAHGVYRVTFIYLAALQTVCLLSSVDKALRLE